MRCAIYTRVSTDNQVEKDYNSLETQKESLMAYIQAHKYEGWELYDIYEDAGYSAADLNRPELQRLLNDIRRKKINIVLVYKIDRLTRSPKDFYQLIELFEKYNISFISITERFDTSTPAGRLLRNIMLIFAQFERELASERTKDFLFPFPSLCTLTCLHVRIGNFCFPFSIFLTVFCRFDPNSTTFDYFITSLFHYSLI